MGINDDNSVCPACDYEECWYGPSLCNCLCHKPFTGEQQHGCRECRYDECQTNFVVCKCGCHHIEGMHKATSLRDYRIAKLEYWRTLGATLDRAREAFFNTTCYPETREIRRLLEMLDVVCKKNIEKYLGAYNDE